MPRERYLILLFVIGALLPTSTGGNLSSAFVFLSYTIGFLLLVYGAWKFGASELGIIFCFIPVLIVLCFSTVCWALNDVRLAKLGVYGASALMFCLRWKPAPLRYGNHILLAISTFNVVLGIGIVVHWPPAVNIVDQLYAAFFPHIVPTMLALHKPVLTYGTHSLAAFFIYLFYWMNFRTFEVKGYKVNLGFAIAHAALCAALVSHTSFAFALLAFGEIGLHYVRRKPYVVIACVLVMISLIPMVGTVLGSQIRGGADIYNLVSDFVVFTWTDKEGGLAGRFNAGGNMSAPVTYIADHPLSPIGLSTRGDFNLDDSGPIEYMLRGSLPLLILMYGGVWYLVRSHLSRADALRLFLCILGMEIGFSVLTYHRSIFLIPAFLMYLGSLQHTPGKAHDLRHSAQLA